MNIGFRRSFPTVDTTTLREYTIYDLDSEVFPYFLVFRVVVNGFLRTSYVFRLVTDPSLTPGQVVYYETIRKRRRKF